MAVFGNGGRFVFRPATATTRASGTPCRSLWRGYDLVAWRAESELTAHLRSPAGVDGREPA